MRPYPLFSAGTVVPDLPRTPMNRSLFALVAVLACGSVQAELPPLTADGLARCAAQVQSLRAESQRLVQKNTQIDQRRNFINARTAALDAERAQLPPDQLAAGLDFHTRAKRHREETVAFNAEVEQFKREVIAVNQVKQDYDRSCANRSYRRKDLEAMPETARNAMRIGLSDVQVPYLDPSAIPR